jgi:hypothetical protein
MIRRRLLRVLTLSSLLAAGVLAGPAAATQIWSGRTFAFSKAPFANPNLPANQDRITPLVWITRANTMGIYNIKSETAYVHNVSPAGTEWATGDAINHASLTFQDWENWTGNNPPATIGVNACVHLISEDIYLDIVFDTFGGGTSGGTFSYHRAVDPTTPTAPTSWGRIKKLYR